VAVRGLGWDVERLEKLDLVTEEMEGKMMDGTGVLET